MIWSRPEVLVLGGVRLPCSGLGASEDIPGGGPRRAGAGSGVGEADDKLLADGRIKAKPRKTSRTDPPVHVRRLTADGRMLPCRQYRYDSVRCCRQHATDDRDIGQPIQAERKRAVAPQKATLPPGLDPKTVVNTHRMLHRAWKDFVIWGAVSIPHAEGRSLVRNRPLTLVAGAGFEPATSGL
jgi:hypothetical protein